MNNIKIDADLRAATHHESLETLRRQMRTVLGINLVNSALIAGFTWQHANHNLLILWGVAVWVLSLVRVDLWRRYGKIDHPIEIDETQQLRFSVFTSGLSGLLWGLAPVLFFTPMLTPHQLFLLFVAGGMAAGATATLFVHRPSYYVFVVPCLFMPALWYIGQQEYFQVMMGVLFTVYALALIGIATNNHRMFVEAVRLRLELSRARDRAEAGSRAKNEFISVVTSVRLKIE